MFPFSKFYSEDCVRRYEEQQKEIVDRIVSSDKKYVILNAPTGTGKSLIAMMAGFKMNHTVNYVCTTKMLQDQLKYDFPESVVIKGRSNYQCNKYGQLTAGDCSKKCAEYEEGHLPCNYEDEKSRMLRSKYRVLNTSYWLSEANFAGRLSNQKLVVLDEADRLENELTGFIGLNISKHEIQTYGLNPPKYVTKLESWIDWANDAYNILESNYPGCKVCATHMFDKVWVRGFKLKMKIRWFSKVVDESWVFDKNYYGGWVFNPVLITEKVAEQYVWKHSEKFLLMSATPPLPKTIGLSMKDVDIIEADNVYPVKNRLVYYDKSVNMSFKNKDNHWMIKDKIQMVVDRYPDYKGIIHTVSYKIRDLIMEMNNDRFITHDSKDKDKILDIFKESKDPLVLVSPSSERGLSLNDELARFCIWAKVPFGNLGDKYIKAKAYSKPFGSEWYNNDAAQNIVQGCGRGVRSIDDWCYSYIFDEQFDRVIKYCARWFKESIVFGNGINNENKNEYGF